MPLLRVITRSIGPNDEGVECIAVTLNRGERREVVPLLSTMDPNDIGSHEYAIGKTITREEFDRVASYYKVGEVERGHQFTIFLKPEDPNVSRETTKED